MANTPKLNVPEIGVSQVDKYLTHNTALRYYDALVQGNVIDKDLTAAPDSPSDGDTYIVAGSDSSDDPWNPADTDDLAYYNNTAWLFLVPDPGWEVYVVDEAKFYVFVDVSTGWMSRESVSAEAWTDLDDTPASYSGEAYKIPRVNSAETAQELVQNSFNAGAYKNGTVSASYEMLRVPFTENVEFLDDFSGSKGTAKVAATASTVFLIKKNDVQIGTMTYAAAATVATFATSGGGVETFGSATPDVLSVEGPASPDATLANVGFLLRGYQV